MRHTDALTYSRWERFVFRVTGRWPQSVVYRRLLAADLDLLEARTVLAPIRPVGPDPTPVERPDSWDF